MKFIDTSFFIKSSLETLVETAASNGNKRADFLLRNGFDCAHQRNLAKIVIYYQEFNYEEIYETAKYTVSCEEILIYHIVQALIFVWNYANNGV